MGFYQDRNFHISWGMTAGSSEWFIILQGFSCPPCPGLQISQFLLLIFRLRLTLSLSERAKGGSLWGFLARLSPKTKCHKTRARSSCINFRSLFHWLMCSGPYFLSTRGLLVPSTREYWLGCWTDFQKKMQTRSQSALCPLFPCRQSSPECCLALYLHGQFWILREPGRFLCTSE